jgi:carbamoyltransferase
MKTLLLSLGHGASAILIEDNKIVCGYENERLTKIKSDSQYPSDAIEAIDIEFDVFDVETVMISHWFIDGQLPTVPNKYFNRLHLNRLCPSAEIMCVNIEFTHHDAHMYSAKLFAGRRWTNQPDVLGIVADGFGTMGETLSIYNCSEGVIHLNHRSFGFSSSLGLLYQYATSYLGMKENQDEYKLLGYEPSVYKYFSEAQINGIDTWSDIEVTKQIKDIATYETKHRYDPMCSLDALPALKLLYRQHFDALLKAIGVDKELVPMEQIKCAIAYYVQKRVEDVLVAIVQNSGTKRLLLTGGVFMNVKLNNRLLQLVDEICIMPLCGDQGAALGVYEAANPGKLEWPDHLLWGTREFKLEKLDKAYMINTFTVDEHAAAGFIAKHLDVGFIVNVVRGDMEYGSRALCNTTTLAYPTKKNVEYINHVNARSTIMPMAPVMSAATADEIFNTDELRRVHKSLEYMVCTLTYKDHYGVEFKGAAHQIPGGSKWSGRPQITEDPFMLDILDSVAGGVLINTSFNMHGEPIVFDTDDIIASHEFQKKRDKDDLIITVVIGDSK